MNGMTTILLLTAPRIVLPVLFLVGIGTYIERRQSSGM